ncbi:Hypothetical Protein FCC1311_037352 [Hondaea fermentalgiana]|uniref:Uncharacterized protein n=1 Tax=Hondaea fermentalgiana TaxID=2315210 RepID=A0A2R5G8Y0_9STRA|nr:Hypothetical Protein FCC1311_037352 [Hondaea fermentalgiana]|eukprot:GBG27512.1 Hypothetical Protein FCC1311_037352 [Hondaea fermentalgiana]
MPVQPESTTPRAYGPATSPRVALSNKQSGFHNSRYVRSVSVTDELSLDGMRLDSPVSSNPQEPVESWHQNLEHNPVTPRAWRNRVHAPRIALPLNFPRLAIPAANSGGGTDVTQARNRERAGQGLLTYCLWNALRSGLWGGFLGPTPRCC